MRTEVTSNLVGEQIITSRLQLVAWEITRSCNLSCAHCRASAQQGTYQGELTTNECFRLLDQIAAAAKPIIILTGGEPLARPDLIPIARYAAGLGLRVVLGSNGTLVSGDMARSLKDVPIARLGVSLDFPTESLQDKFRGKAGAFREALQGLANARQAGLPIQINATITKLNVAYLNDLVNLAIEVGASAFHPFLLVPTGRGKGLESVELSSEEYEATLNWIYDKQQELGDRIFFKPTDAPHYLRIVKQRERSQPAAACPTPQHSGHHPANSLSRGCLAGTGFCFISHVGRVQGCGYLDVSAGNIKEQTFGEIWENSPLFRELRDLSKIKGKCGACEYKRICGGCRARAYETSGDYLAAEPYCVYQPRACGESANA
ncbi:MAG: radical SAM protein [Dehalococcoidia bacterium]|nr:MAG: radical SAM protein [Dehalococcoidia bacterium]